MKTSPAGVDLIKHYEGLRNSAYLCPAKKWTVGFGSTFWPDGTPVKEGDRVTDKEAEALLAATLLPFEREVDRMVTVPISQGQFDALVSFSFNLGSAALRGSTLLKKLNQGDKEGASIQFGAWVKAAGQVLPGLVKRRESERKMFLS